MTPSTADGPGARPGPGGLPRGAGGTSGYAVALGAVAASLVFSYALRDSWGPRVPYLPFYPAIIVAAWYGGLGPGLVATTISTLAVMFWLPQPAGLAAGDASGQLSLAVFAGTGLVIAWLNHRIRLADKIQRAAAATATARAERLDAVLNTTVDGVIVIDAKGCIEAFNRGAEQLFGYPESEVLGRNVSLLMPSPHHEQHDSYLERYLTTGEARIIGIGREVSARRRDGTVFPVQLSVGEMRIGGERKFTGLLHDLTKRARLGQQLQASEARWRAVIDSAVDGIIVIDAHGRIESFNPGAERLFGHTEREVIGRSVNLLMPSPYREEHDTYLARYITTGRARIIGKGREVQGLRKDGTTFPLHLSVGEMTVGGERRFTGILHDLSVRAQMEAHLREQEALARLGEMSAVIAHEVKNPLAGIRGAVQVIGGRMPADSASAPIFKDIVSRIDSLDQMMKDLLVFARPPVPRVLPTDVGALVTATADLLSHDPALRDIAIEVEGSSPLVPVDPDMLKIVFHNLLINSAQAMQGQGRIKVLVTSADTMCRISFTDSGPGIPADVRQKIFIPFFTTKSRGSGLGLATAKRLIDAHSGRISVDCPAAGGTNVIVQLPLTSASTGG